jgi:hypothetical protein
MKFVYLALLVILPLAVLQGEEKACIREIESTFFNPFFVSQALSLHDVSQSTWSQVNLELQKKIPSLHPLVLEKAAKMQPNPLKTPFQPHEAAQVVEEALYEVFASVLAEFNIQNAYEIREMFNYIREQQNSRFVDCFGPQENKFVDKSVQKNKP